MSEWISVNDRLPEIGEEVLIAFSDYDLMVGELLPDGQGFANPYERVNYKIVTHWMPLPQKPESEGEYHEKVQGIHQV